MELGHDSSFLSDAVYIYSIPISFILGIQYVWASLVSAIEIPIQNLGGFCLLPDDMERGVVLSKILVFSGISSLAQSLFGARFPVIILPSIMLVSASSELLQSSYWEQISDGDLYAMGLELRESEFRIRSSELRGAILTAASLSSFGVGILWFLNAKIPSCTVHATLLSLSIGNILRLVPTFSEHKYQEVLLTILSLFLLITFYLSQNLSLSCLKVITTEDHKVKLKTFKLFPVLLTLVISYCFLEMVQWEEPSLSERAATPHHWLSFLYIPTGFNAPAFSLRMLVFLPTLLAQGLGSYCFYNLLTQNSERAVLLEYGLNIVSSCLGLVFPLAVDPASLGLAALAQVKNPESTVISGSLLIVMGSFLKVVALSSRLPLVVQSAVGAYLYAQLISKVVLEAQRETAENLSGIAISTACGLVISSFTAELHTNIILSVLTLLLKNPVIVTFSLSLILQISFKGFVKSK